MLGPLIGQRYRLEMVSSAFTDVLAGDTARGAVRPWQE